MSMQTVRQLALSVTMMVGLCLGDVLSPWAATAATYYVATTGSDANPGTQARPFRTIAKGISVLTASDTLYIRQGTYVESISTHSQVIPSGTSWTTAITIAGYPGETVTLRSTEGTVLLLNAYNNPQVSSLRYLIFDNLVFDAAGSGGGVSIYGNADHIRIQNSEVKNASQQGIHGGAGPTAIEFINLKVYNNGSNRGDHGFYISIPSALIQGSDIYNNSGCGIQVYGGLTDNTTIRNNRVHDNRDCGVTLNHGNNILFYNNSVYDNVGTGVAVSHGTPTNTQIDSNIIYNNWNGIYISTSSLETIIQNNILYDNVVPIDDRGIRTILIDNTTTDP